jgi:hypothetical protein
MAGMFWLGVPLGHAAGLALRMLLPTSRADHHHSYGSLLGSLVHLWRDLPACAARPDARPAVGRSARSGAFSRSIFRSCALVWARRWRACSA